MLSSLSCAGSWKYHKKKHPEQTARSLPFGQAAIFAFFSPQALWTPHVIYIQRLKKTLSFFRDNKNGQFCAWSISTKILKQNKLSSLLNECHVFLQYVIFSFS